MSWASKPSYPSHAFNTVTLKATDGQASRWGYEAKKRGMARGAFVAFCADFYCNFLRAQQDTREDYDRAMHPENWRERSEREEG